MAINININIIAVHAATARPGVSHVQSYETESTCPTCSASQSPPGALEGGQVHWNSQWTALGDKHTHTLLPLHAATHILHVSHRSKQSVNTGPCVGRTPQRTQQNQNRAKHIDTKEAREQRCSSARVPRAVGQVWCPGCPRSPHQWALGRFPYRIITTNPPPGTNYTLLHSFTKYTHTNQTDPQ